MLWELNSIWMGMKKEKLHKIYFWGAKLNKIYCDKLDVRWTLTHLSTNHYAGKPLSDKVRHTT